MKRDNKSKFRGTLLSRYLLIIIIALLFIPVVFPVSLVGYQIIQVMVINHMYPKTPEQENLYIRSSLENVWHKEAKQLEGAAPAQIDARLQELGKKYELASMFWVDQQDHIRQAASGKLQLPQKWNASDAIAFMKNDRTDSNNFSVVAFIGDEEKLGQGFMVIEVPKSSQKSRSDVVSSRGYGIIYIIILAMFTLFIAISWMFFVNMRRRLLRLQSAMTVQGKGGLPQPIVIKKVDEIGRLEDAFNGMVAKLGSSQQREREEEELRKQLIANLSHDLRTPLTVIRGHVYSLQKEPLTDKGRELLQLTESKLSDLGGLIDNLLSYNLLTSGRYTLQQENVDVLRIVRESAAAWYPLWEKEQFEVEVNVYDEPLYWVIDAQWFRRILDNLFQNVLRHAHSGQYIGIYTEEHGGKTAIVIADKGKGMGSSSGGKGAGIGLAIVGFLTREMGISMDIQSSAQGTRIFLHPADGRKPGLKIKE